MQDYTKKQLLEISQKIPEELKDTLFSDKTVDDIFDICQKNKVPKQKISPVAKYVTRVLLGLLPINEFKNILEKELKFNSNIAKKVAQEINQLIFHPVKSSLEKLYKTEITSSTPKSAKSDVYRETIE